jgi:hypothetical protein
VYRPPLQDLVCLLPIVSFDLQISLIVANKNKVIGASTATVTTFNTSPTPTSGGLQTSNTMIFVTGVVVHSTSVIAQQSFTNTSISLSSNTTIASTSTSQSIIVGVPVIRSSSTAPPPIAPPSTSSTPPPKTAGPGNGNILGVPPSNAASSYVLPCKSIMALFAVISVCILSNSCT